MDNSKQLTTKMKDRFNEDMFQREFSNQIKSVPNATKLFFKTKTPTQHLHVNTNPVDVFYGEDSLYEIYDLVAAGHTVAASNAANAKVIGGGFTTYLEQRNGKGTQEESLMCLLSGLLTSILHFALRYKSGKILRDPTSGRIHYFRQPLAHNLVFSEEISPRIKMSVFEAFKKDREGFKFFNDYVAFKYSTSPDVLTSDFKKCIGIFSMAAFDRRGKKSNGVDYGKLKLDTKRQISTMLKHAKEKKYTAVVLTIPGSGVFANYRFNDSTKDEQYLAAVEDATFEAIKEYGTGFEKIIICGCRKQRRKAVL